MPARDLFHDAVRNALIKDGWTITHDPFRLSWGGRDLLEKHLVRVAGFDPDREVIVQWKR